MPHAIYTPTLWTTWSQTLSLLAQTAKSVWKIALGFFVAPLLAFEIYAGYQGIEAANAIEQAVAIQDHAPIPSGYLTLIASFYTLLGPYLAGLLGVTLILLTGYLVLTLLFLQVRSTQPPAPLQLLCLQGVKLLVPKGIPFFSFLLLLSLEQAFFSSLRVFSAFALLAIVISLYEKQGMWRSVIHALFFRYTSPQRGGAFRIAFILIMTLSFVAMAQLGIELLFLQLQMGGGRIGEIPAMLQTPILGTPFSPLGLIGHCLRMGGYSFLLVFLAGFSVTLYMEASPTLGERLTE